MEFFNVCRICLSNKAFKDIFDLRLQQNQDKSVSEIILFCLSVQIDVDSNISTRLCSNCFRKMMSFYDFKLLALKSDKFLRSLQPSSPVKTETFLDEQLKYEEVPLSDISLKIKLSPEIKQEQRRNSNSDAEGSLIESLGYEELDTDVEIPISTEIKQEQITNNNSEVEDFPQSDDELLSNIKKVQYEFIPEDIDETNETVLKRNSTTTKKIIKLKDDVTGVCAKCGEDVTDLKGHMRKHRKDANGRYPCLLCDKTFASSDGRYKHKIYLHLGVKNACPICKKMVSGLKMHMKRKHGELSYECRICQKRFSSEGILRNHEVFHSSERPYECDVCGKKFRSNEGLAGHKKEVHDKLRPEMCHYCCKAFLNRARLRRHLRIHTKEKPYVCKECGKGFATSTALKNHQVVHSTEMPHECSVCAKKFAHIRYLEKHMVCHTREKRYSCHYCEWKFHRSDHVKQHEAAVHKIQFPKASE